MARSTANNMIISFGRSFTGTQFARLREDKTEALQRSEAVHHAARLPQTFDTQL